MADALLSDCNDVSTFGPDGAPGLQPGKRVRGVRCVLEWVARRLLSRAGALAWDVTTRVDVADLENGDPSPRFLASLPALIESEARLVPFVRRASAKVALDPAGRLTVTVGVDVASAGVYPLIVTAANGRVALSFPPVRT